MDGRPGRPGGGGAANYRMRGRRGAFGERLEHLDGHELNDHTSESLEHQCVSRLGRPGCPPCRGSLAGRRCAAGVSATLQTSPNTSMKGMQRLKASVPLQENLCQDLFDIRALRRRRRGFRGTAQHINGCVVWSRGGRTTAGTTDDSSDASFDH